MTGFDQPTGTAYHEAGHAVASWLLERGIVRVSIAADEETLGFVEHYPRQRWQDRLEEADYQSSWGGFIDARLRRGVETDIMISLAGGMTEQELTGVPDYETGSGISKLTEEEAQELAAKLGGKSETLITHGDWRRVMDLAYKVSSSEKEAWAYVAWLQERTRSLMGHPLFEPAVRALAGALLEHRILTARRARQVIEAAMEQWRSQT